MVGAQCSSVEFQCDRELTQRIEEAYDAMPGNSRPAIKLTPSPRLIAAPDRADSEAASTIRIRLMAGRRPRKPKPPAAFVYVLGASGKDGFKTYVGWTTDLAARLAAHNAGKGARSTRGRTWTLLYAEPHKTRSAAMSREWHLKRDREFRKALRSNRAA